MMLPILSALLAFIVGLFRGSVANFEWRCRKVYRCGD